MGSTKYMLLIDTSRCIACRACQVACKLWHALPPEGNIEPRLDLTGTTFTLVRETEEDVDGKLRRLFFKDQCRHCARPRCKEACPLGAIVTEQTGAVVITDICNPDLCVTPSGETPCELKCPYDIPRLDWTRNKFRKCDLCYDRIRDGSGRGTACADACVSEAIFFGTAEEVEAEARTRLEKLKARYPNANLGGASSNGRVKWILIGDPDFYGLHK
jgi:formate dehydrogenase iron-sulfur subunit